MLLKRYFAKTSSPLYQVTYNGQSTVMSKVGLVELIEAYELPYTLRPNGVTIFGSQEVIELEVRRP